MKEEERKSILIDAIKVFGQKAQIEMAVEECAELIVALKQFYRGRNKIQDVITEIADVYIMMKQLSEMVGVENVDKEIDWKLERLKTRIEEYKNK